MAYAIMTIPFDPITKGFHPEELNRFCLNKKIVTKMGRCEPGKGDGQFNEPYGIAVDSSGYVYVGDTGNNRIQKFKPQ